MNTNKNSACKNAFTIVVCLCAVLLTGCAYQGGDVIPLARKLSWYSYLNGDDLRQACDEGQGDTLRLVYNAIHKEQIRTYDITAIPDDGGLPTIKARVLGYAELSRIGIIPASNLVAPWLGDNATTRIRKEDMTQLWEALEASGAFAPAPAGLNLESEQFFWLTAICRDGSFFYNAYVWPSDRFDEIRFDDLLFAWDMTDVAVNPPRTTTPFEIYGEANPKKGYGAYYQVTIGKNGLKGFE